MENWRYSKVYTTGIEEEKDNAENENINIDDEIELESDFVVDRISRGQPIM